MVSWNFQRVNNQSKFKISFKKLSSPNVRNLVHSLNHHSWCGYIDNTLELKSNNRYDYIEECFFPEQVVE
jgi:hypothetical protein